MSETHAQLVQRLKSKDYEAIAARMASPQMIDIQHALMGIQSEGGELADAVKRHLFYGTELDLVNLQEESGDLLWYIELLLAAIGYSMPQASNMNKAKLIKRFGTAGFTEEAAVNRDTDAERVILERDAV